MKKILGIIIGGVIICVIAGYYFIIHRPKVAENKKLTLSEYITDVIELKSRNNIIGKILKETAGSVLIRNAEGTMEISVLKKQIANIRKATVDDIKAVQDEIDRAPEAAKKALLFEKEREARLKVYYEERDKREIAAASRGQGQAGSVETVRNAKDRGQVISGMSENDVLEVYGSPDSKERDDKGNAERERWIYTGLKEATVNFYKGKVE